MNNTFSIIIPFQETNSYVIDCINLCLELDYDEKKYDIFLLPDNELRKEELLKEIKESNRRRFNGIVIIHPTGLVTPGIKRNIAMKQSKADYFACIDSDAYPDKDWLKNALEVLQYKEIGIVGGPNRIPKKTTGLERLAISVLYLNVMAKGLYTAKKFKDKGYEYTLMASSNFIIKKDVAKEAGYFDEEYYPGEDAILSYNVLDKGYKIIYSPDVIVYHHRRPLFWKHLKKMKETAESTSSVLKQFKKHRRISHFLPSIFTGIIVLCIIFGFVNSAFFIGLGICQVIYFLILICDSVINEIYNPLEIILVTLGAFLTHLFYGYGFIKGLIKKSKKLKTIVYC